MQCNLLNTKETNKKYISKEVFLIGFSATTMGGFLDAYTYVLHDKVFANTQTGNLILLAIYLFEGNFKEAMLRLIPIVLFFIGIFLFEILNLFNKNYSIKISLILQAILISFIGFGLFGNNSIIICGTISFICAMQLVSFKKINDMPYATIMCTGNLRSFSQFFSKFILYKKKEDFKNSILYLLIVLIFCLGVFLGMFFIKILGAYSILVLLINVLIKFFILHKFKANL